MKFDSDILCEMSVTAVSIFDASSVARTRRFLEGSAAVAVWMTIGLVFHTSVIAYLLVGIPITIIFQRYVRRAPLKAMWVRDSPPFRLGLMGVTFAIGLSVAPLADLIMQFRSHGWIVDSWYLVAIIGAWPAAYALRYFRRRTFRELLISIFTAGAVGSAIMVAAALAGAGSHQSAWSKVAIGLASFLEYVPVTFLLEEVWFRGVLDSHLHHRGESRGGFSAIFVSALWGLWHYPISKEPYQLKTLLPTVLALLVVHIPIGALLSRSWRRSENLLVTCIVHALIDGVRDAVLGVPS